MQQDFLLLGQVLSFAASPFETADPTQAVQWHEGVLVRDGRIAQIGKRTELIAAAPQAEVVDHGQHIICAGFVDAHAHYPQTAMIASWGKRLIDWLNSYTFPEELRFKDPDYASKIANRYLDLTTAEGTTTVVSYCTVHPTSVDAIFTAAQARGQRVVAGKTCMDRNAPEGLCDTAQSSYDDSAALLAKWHGLDRLSYAITPRFSPTSTSAQLEAMGALWSQNPDCLMQTHLSEQRDEVAWVRELFPQARDYLDTYEQFGLLREGAVFGHAIYLEAREKDRLREVNASLIHCPTSNSFIGSGIFDMAGMIAAGQRIGLATDTGGGSSFSMLRTMAAAYELGQLNGAPLHPTQLIWLATQGSARALRMCDKIGNIAVGNEADLVVLDLASTAAIAQRHAEADDIWEAIFPTLMMGDDRAISEVRIAGRKAV